MKKILIICCLWGLSSTALAVPHAEEQQLEAKINRQLEAILGPGKARVSVSGQQSSPYQQRSRSYSNPQVGAETQTRSRSQGAEYTQQRRQWVFDSSETLTQHQPVGLRQKSVSVIYEPKVGEEGQSTDPALIEGIVKGSINYQPEQGDRVVVKASRFDNSWQQRLEAELRKAQQQTPWWVFVALALGSALLGAAGGAWLLRRRRKNQPADPWQVQTYPVWSPPVAPAAESGPLIYVQPQALDK